MRYLWFAVRYRVLSCVSRGKKEGRERKRDRERERERERERDRETLRRAKI